jgi:hypothetical protein
MARRVSNGEQVNRVAGLAMASKRGVDFAGTGSGMSAIIEPKGNDSQALSQQRN